MRPRVSFHRMYPHSGASSYRWSVRLEMTPIKNDPYPQIRRIHFKPKQIFTSRLGNGAVGHEDRFITTDLSQLDPTHRVFPTPCLPIFYPPSGSDFNSSWWEREKKSFSVVRSVTPDACNPSSGWLQSQKYPPFKWISNFFQYSKVNKNVPKRTSPSSISPCTAPNLIRFLH